MEITDRLSTLHRSDQIRVVERVFQKLLLAFGNQLTSKWQGLDMQEVYADWADAMQGLTLGSVNHGIELAGNERNPPNKGEFVEFCRKYNPNSSVLKLAHKLTPEEMARNRERIAEIAASLAKRKEA